MRGWNKQLEAVTIFWYLSTCAHCQHTLISSIIIISTPQTAIQNLKRPCHNDSICFSLFSPKAMWSIVILHYLASWDVRLRRISSEHIGCFVLIVCSHFLSINLLPDQIIMPTDIFFLPVYKGFCASYTYINHWNYKVY